MYEITNENADTTDIEKLESLNVGVFGHIDHGKTTLVYKLTGKFTDTHSEELKRGITIKLGYADCIVYQDDKLNIKKGKPLRYLSFVDAPGHEMLMATMLSGAAIIDVAILVIAANEGIKPQTREHFQALRAKNIKNFIIVQNKIDLVTREKALENYKAITALVKGTEAETAKIIPVSAQQEINIDKIFNELVKIPIPKRDTTSSPIFIVARSFDINRPGTKIKDLKGGVLGGALKKGKMKVDDIIEIKPGVYIKKENQLIYQTIKTKILGIFKGKYRVSEAVPGGSLALETELDPILTKSDNLAGCVAGFENSLPEIVSSVKIKFNLFKEVLGIEDKKEVESIKMSEALLISMNTSISVGQVTKLKENEAELFLKIPIVPFKGDNVGIARNISGHWRLIGWGEVM